MSGLLAFAIAAELSSSPFAGLLTPNDVPTELLTPNRLQTVAVAVTVGPDGKIQDCIVEGSSGNPKLDALTCKKITRRAKFEIPKDSEGLATYAVFRTPIEYWIGDTLPPKSNYANLEVTVSDLPVGLKSPVIVPVKFAVDTTGSLSRCQGETGKEPPELVPIACSELETKFKPRPAVAPDGRAVSSVQDATVLFVSN